jgi:tRNA 2-thiouridine synthesizing protein A
MRAFPRRALPEAEPTSDDDQQAAKMAGLTESTTGGLPVAEAPYASSPERTRRFLSDVERLTGLFCRACDRILCGHDAVAAVVLGSRDAPACTHCLAIETTESGPALRERVWQYVRRHECFATGWRAANTAEGLPAEAAAECRHGVDAPAQRHEVDALSPLPVLEQSPSAPGGVNAAVAVASWDAGDLACGELLMELRRRLRALPPGARFRLVALDPSAPEDVPSWCRLTGHRLLAARHPNYEIQSREE